MRFAGDSACPPIIEPLGSVATVRLNLQPLQSADGDRLAPLFANEEVWHFPYGRGLSRDETSAFIDGQLGHWDRFGFGLWLVEERSTNRAIGYVGLSVPAFLPEVLPAVEVGWRLDPGAWGKGYATEGGAAALEQAFVTLGLDRVISLPQIDKPRVTPGGREDRDGVSDHHDRPANGTARAGRGRRVRDRGGAVAAHER